MKNRSGGPRGDDRLSVDLLARIRETRPFPSVDALRTQLTDDVRRAAEIAAALP